MKRKKLITVLIAIFYMVSTFSLGANPIITQCGSYSGPPAQIQIPVTVQNFSGVGSISLFLTICPATLSYISYIPNPVLTAGMMICQQVEDQIRFAWFGLSPISLPSGSTLITFKLNALEGSCPLAWDTATAGNCQFCDVNGNIIDAIFIDGSVFAGTPLPDLSGHVKYASPSQIPLMMVNVSLMQGSTSIAQAQTDNYGYFEFPDINPGLYTLVSSYSLPWGGCNMTDALLILQHYAQQNILSGLPLKAADVNANNYINTSDALLVARRFVGLIYAFPAGDWYFTQVEVEFNGTAIQNANISGICFGDVNVSYSTDK